ncbi:MAG: FHA domain-containing protein [Planctomycetes bacterium]|nr:FHA domain-containing protein [Planctomycetota bacterium]
MHIAPATIAGATPDRFVRPAPGLELIGVLSPLVGSMTRPVHITEQSLLIGRDGNVDLQLTDQLVSRRHARILRDGEQFRLEDLGSVNGTFVDGVPVVSCMLHDGDTLQFGCTLFYFDRLYTRSGPGGPVS